MPKWAVSLRDLLDFLALGYRPLFIIACLCWTIIFIPANIWQNTGLLTLSMQSRPWIFLIGIISSVWFIFGGLYDVIKSGYEHGNKWWSSRKNLEGRQRVLSMVSRSEKEILIQYVESDTTTLAFDARDGVVNGLVGKGILYKASTLSNPSSVDFDVNIQPWAWEYLKNNPELLKGISPPKTNRHQLF